MRHSKNDLDLIVVGAGSGGLAAAKSAAGLGAKVALVEAGRVGGTCVLRGCVPKKIMVFASQIGLKAPVAEALGWQGVPSPGGAHDWPTLCRARDRLVGNLEMAHTRHLAEAGVDLVAGAGRVTGSHQVTAAGEPLRADKILWAAGGAPVVPPFAGAEFCLNSDDFFALPRRPDRATIIGGGYIAVEFACMLAALGSQVTLMVRRRLLASFDACLQEEVQESLERLGVDVRLGWQVTGVERQAGGDVVVHARGPAQARQSLPPQPCLLAAIGRRPNTAASGLEEAGVRLAASGAVEVDADHRSTCPSIFALGDVIDRVNLTPVAIRAGRNFAAQQFGDGAPPVSYDLVPKAVFSSPAVGSVGLDEAAARARFGEDVVVFASRFVPLVWSPAATDRRPRALTKLVVRASDDRVVGCHIVGEEAPETIQGFAAALQAGITKRQLDATCAVHPTSAEEMVLMRSPRAARPTGR